MGVAFSSWYICSGPEELGKRVCLPMMVRAKSSIWVQSRGEMEQKKVEPNVGLLMEVSKVSRYRGREVEGDDGKITAKVGISEWTPAETNRTRVHDETRR
jgi:hypothetical protein